MIEHHLDYDMLQQYAAGTLAEGWSVAVATHLALCPACRSKLSVLESVGGYFIDNETADLSEVSQSWEILKAKIEAGQIDKVVPIKKRSSSDTTYPEPLKTYIDAAGGLKWRQFGRSAAQMMIPTGDETTTVRLLKIPAGQPVPEHSHRGVELTLVLDGSFSDEVSTFARGDIEMADDGLMHQPKADADRDCICLAVTEAPLRFKSRFLRLIQPLLGI
ncbi:putative transcriptional regulator [Rhizobium leguminosarum]|uniref:Putative transcriptional regulator n=1 Tax=Rhizobium leguminosarum TaxID=384 RepID=A0A7W9ZNF4_RHILE|nr:ChrR family anti-sigma-E factor [Rhizobium leguminosarum]MBB5661849.1 putative transcriptional regulator [Rhizobium leguminosarum]MBB6219873.1 putative transcriptional regulator [Rhizobium leguminosarum]NYJ13321.1 putative transcriptional regulator [Rhizobium leguminosarum]